MAKFNIEVELDWIEDGYTVDEELKEQIVYGIKEELLRQSKKEVVSKLDAEIAKVLQDATKEIDSRVDDFVGMVCQSKIEKMKIPYKENSWGSEIEYIPITEYIGQRYESFLNKKVFNDKGRIPDYDYDKKLSISEYFINNYLQKELAGKVSDMIQKAKKESEETVLKKLEQNLKDQLAVDTIKRLNIPKLLENLQQKALEFEETELEVSDE